MWIHMVINVLFNIRFGCKASPTVWHWTTEWPISLMILLRMKMASALAISCSILQLYLYDMYFQRNGIENNYLVCTSVLIKDRLLSEVFPTLTTLIWFLSRMNAYVLHWNKKIDWFITEKSNGNDKRFVLLLPDSRWFAVWRSADNKCNHMVFHLCVSVSMEEKLKNLAKICVNYILLKLVHLHVNAEWDAIVDGSVYHIPRMDTVYRTIVVLFVYFIYFKIMEFAFEKKKFKSPWFNVNASML